MYKRAGNSRIAVPCFFLLWHVVSEYRLRNAVLVPGIIQKLPIFIRLG